MQSSFTFLALGDSYTIGEAVHKDERWPNQLVRHLKKDGVNVDEPKIIATTGWTTDELLAAINEENIDETYSMVSLLIGVNNQYRGYPIEQYEKEFHELLDLAILYAGEKPENVFVISIPDYGVTPFALDKDLKPKTIANELDRYNEIAENISISKNVSFIDITKDSKKASADPSLITSDGLHPSGKMYAQWVESVYSLVYDNLSTR